MGGGSILYQLSTKLIVAFSLVTLVALVLAGVVYVVLTRDEQEQQALEHAIVRRPFIFADFRQAAIEASSEARYAGSPFVPTLIEKTTAVAGNYDMRILLVHRDGISQGTVLMDSSDGLVGEQLPLPQELFGDSPYVAWETTGDSPGRGLVFVSSLDKRSGGDLTEVLLLVAVPEETIADAWLGVLPTLGIAAAIALPVAVVLALLVSHYITRPIQQLTLASQQLAGGDFDVRVQVDRRDEVGRLARTFSSMAQRVGEAHSQMRALLANVSHDLKTPLTSILGFSQALRDGGASAEEARHMGEVIHEEAERLSSRLNDLLYLSELESGQSVVARDDIDLQKLVESCVRRVEPDLRARDVTVNVDVEDGLTLQADGTKLERALDNLLDNARKFTPPAGDVRVRAIGEANGRRAVRIEVANSADGLAADELPHLFERFYRRDSDRAATQGSGLGLPIARDLIELHGGTLEATVDEGELVFTATLPADGES
jgi:signal transduction histidine kinase